jgi:phage shock protein C
MEPKRFYRSRNDRVLAGVCGGLAEYFDIDPLLIRLLFVVLALIGGGGFLLYIILWIVTKEVPAGWQASPVTPTPENRQGPAPDPQPAGDTPKPQPAAVREPRPRKKHKGLIGGLVLITLGILFLIQEFSETLDFGDLWPVLLVVIGLGLLFIAVAGRNEEIK